MERIMIRSMPSGEWGVEGVLEIINAFPSNLNTGNLKIFSTHDGIFT